MDFLLKEVAFSNFNLKVSIGNQVENFFNILYVLFKIPFSKDDYVVQVYYSNFS
jgi:hypothetical protein